MKKLQVGDIFVCEVDDGDRYFQYLGVDEGQIGGWVIAVFSGIFPRGDLTVLNTLLELPVEFYTHTNIKAGEKLNAWRKVGNLTALDMSGVLFRVANDRGSRLPDVSNDWTVWYPNHEYQKIGALTSDFRRSFIGTLNPTHDVVERLKTGKFLFKYPIPAGDGEYWQ